VQDRQADRDGAVLVKRREDEPAFLVEQLVECRDGRRLIGGH
jgi:hypothetical protein